MGKKLGFGYLTTNGESVARLTLLIMLIRCTRFGQSSSYLAKFVPFTSKRVSEGKADRVPREALFSVASDAPGKPRARSIISAYIDLGHEVRPPERRLQHGFV